MRHLNGKQRGATLILTLVFLLVLTVLAVSQISVNSLLTRIATNSGDALVAFQTAEGALSQAANLILSGTYSLSNFLANSNGLYVYNASNAPVWSTVNWSGSAVILSYQGNSSARAAFMIEQLPSVTMPGQSMSKPTLIYRVSARAVGASGNGAVILQAIIAFPQ